VVLYCFREGGIHVGSMAVFTGGRWKMWTVTILSQLLCVLWQSSGLCMPACMCSRVSCVQFYCWWTESCGKGVLILEQIIFHSTSVDMDNLLCALFAKIKGRRRNAQGICVHCTLYGLLPRHYEGHDSYG